MDKQVTKVLDYVFDNFDFEKVKDVMDLLQWTWGAHGVPTIDEIKNQVAKMMYECAMAKEDEYIIATGGFRVEKDFSDHNNPWMRVAFEITDCDMNFEELSGDKPEEKEIVKPWLYTYEWWTDSNGKDISKHMNAEKKCGTNEPKKSTII